MDHQTLSRYPAGSLVRVAQIIGNPAKGVPALLPISKRTFGYWVKEGKVPPGIKLGRMRVWPIETILGLAAKAQSDQEQGQTKEAARG